MSAFQLTPEAMTAEWEARGEMVDIIEPIIADASIMMKTNVPAGSLRQFADRIADRAQSVASQQGTSLEEVLCNPVYHSDFLGAKTKESRENPDINLLDDVVHCRMTFEGRQRTASVGNVGAVSRTWISIIIFAIYLLLLACPCHDASASRERFRVTGLVARLRPSISTSVSDVSCHFSMIFVDLYLIVSSLYLICI
jgi:hypothetical protein